MHSILAAMMSWPALLAEGINTGNNDNEGFGGLLGVAVVVAAVVLTTMIVRALGGPEGEKMEEAAEEAHEEEMKRERATHGSHAESHLSRV